MLPHSETNQSRSQNYTQPSGRDTQAADIYLTAIRRAAIPVLSIMDREPFSPTLGCMDRTYWAWKFTDFPGARFQEGLCYLSFLYATPFEDNHYYQKPNLLQWIVNGCDYWSSIQYSRGEFDEAYPFERSLAATAFSSFYISEAWNFINTAMPSDASARLKQTLLRAGNWLASNDETHGFLSNHLAAAAAALYHIYLISGEIRFAERSRYFIEKILNHQSKEGWYEEYGGADPGYQTHGSFYLARYLDLSADTRLLNSLNNSFNFLAHFIHPDGSIGGEYASRNTQTYYPAAFEMSSGISGAARWIAEEMLSSVDDLSAAGLGTVDNYNFFPLLNNYVFAYLACQKAAHHKVKPAAPSPEPNNIHFPDAGILKVRSRNYDLFIGLTKGGVLKAFDRQNHRLILNDCGYLGLLRNGSLISSQWVDKDRKIEISNQEITIEGAFYQISKTVMQPFPFVGFRLFSLTLGRIPSISYWLKSILVKVLIYRRRVLDMHLQRRILLQPERIVVKDTIHGSIGKKIKTLKWVELFTTIHMGSSRYFIPNELETNEIYGSHDVNISQLQGGITLEREYTISAAHE